MTPPPSDGSPPIDASASPAASRARAAGPPAEPDKGTPAAYLAPYQDVVDREGAATFAATLWYDRATQEKRFAVLAHMVRLEGLRLLDAGCGLGDLKAWLDREQVRLQHYIGVDGLEGVIAAAEDRGFRDASFYVADFVRHPEILGVEKPDLIFFSGSLNTVPEAEARRGIAGAWELARQGVGFNFLSHACSPARANADTGPAHRFDTHAWLRWATGITPAVAFRQDYFRGGHDATIVMLHE